MAGRECRVELHLWPPNLKGASSGAAEHDTPAARGVAQRTRVCEQRAPRHHVAQAWRIADLRVKYATTHKILFMQVPLLPQSQPLIVGTKD